MNPFDLPVFASVDAYEAAPLETVAVAHLSLTRKGRAALGAA
jgi:hypothetical protein